MVRTCRTVPPNVVSDSNILKDSKSLEMSHVHTIVSVIRDVYIKPSIYVHGVNFLKFVHR